MDEAYISARPRLKIGTEERTDVADSLQSLVVNLPLHGMAHAEVQVGYRGETEDGAEPQYRFGEVALGDRVQIAFGSEREVRVFDGEVTAIEERYGQGAPRLVWLLQDRLHRLARLRRSRTFEAKGLDAVIQAVAAGAGLEADAAVSAVAATWHQLNESDLAFLLRLIEPFGVGLRLSGGRLRARAEQVDPEPLPLDAEGSALSVRLIADLNHQPTRTWVRGFNAAAAEPATGSASVASDAPAGGTAARLLATLGWISDEEVPQPFARNPGLAQAWAQGHFDRRARDFVSGQIDCRGDPRLAAGREIDLLGVSDRLAGRYRVVHCTHRFDGSGGYRTSLRVSRMDWGA